MITNTITRKTWCCFETGLQEKIKVKFSCDNANHRLSVDVEKVETNFKMILDTKDRTSVETQQVMLHHALNKRTPT